MTNATSLVTGPTAPREVAPSPSGRDALPVLRTRLAVIREVKHGDAAALAAALGSADVRRYLPAGPTTGEHFARFIQWVKREQRAGRYLCFATVPHVRGSAAGLFQLWPVEPGFGTAEMGFALDPALWSSGIFVDNATAVLDFAFDVLGVRRMEFRCAVENGRGAGALRKLGAVREGTLRRCLPCPAGVLDHTMWSILADEWRQRRARRLM